MQKFTILFHFIVKTTLSCNDKYWWPCSYSFFYSYKELVSIFLKRRRFIWFLSTFIWSTIFNNDRSLLNVISASYFIININNRNEGHGKLRSCACVIYKQLNVARHFKVGRLVVLAIGPLQVIWDIVRVLRTALDWVVQNRERDYYKNTKK